MWKKILAGLVTAAALVASFVLVSRLRARPLEEVYTSIKGQVAATAQRHAENEWQFRYWRRPPYIRGKVLILDEESGQLDSAHSALPEDLRATKPDEVGTIVLARCKQIEVGKYAEPGKLPSSGAHGGYQWICMVTIIDRTIPAEIDVGRRFEGSPPPSRSSGPGYGALPTDEIIKYLSSLPRKAMDWKPEEKQQTLYAPADGLSWTELALPPESEYLIQTERPILIRLTDERQLVLFPDGTLTDGGVKVFSMGDVPGAKLFLRAADRDVPPVKVIFSTRPK